MNSRIIVKIYIILLIAWATNIYAQVDDQYSDFNRAGKTIYNFLRVEQGARAVAMGGAFAPVADDLNSIYYNPAGITNIENMEYLFSYNNWLVGSSFYSGAFAYSTNYGTFGLSVVSFSIQEFEETLPLQPEGTGRMVGAGDLAIGLTYAKKITNKLSLGVQGRYISETLDQDTRSTFAVDVGTYYKTGFNDVILAVVLKNVGPDQAVTSRTLAETFQMPIDFNIGLSSKILGSEGETYALAIAAESSYAIDLSDRYRIGAELWLMEIIALRGGYRFNYSNEDYSLGVGISTKVLGEKLNIDFSYTHMIEYFDAPLRVAITGAF